MPRMNILDKSSLDAFQSPPEFTALQRKSCFDLSNKLMEFTMKFREPATRIGFILSWGYFKISKRFYAPEKFHTRDILYVAKYFGYDENIFQPIDYALRTRQRHQLKIIELFNFKKFDTLYEIKINTEIFAMVKQHLKPNLIFWRCIDLMTSDKVSFPTYHKVQDLILSGISKYKAEMSLIIRNNISMECRETLNSLFTQLPESNKFRLTLLKKPSQSMKPVSIKNSLDDLVLLAKLHSNIQPILQQLGLTADGIRYLSASVIKTKTSHLLRKDQADTDLHLVAFIAHQYYRLQDNLMDIFLSGVKSTDNTAHRKHKDWCYENRNSSNKTIINKIDQLRSDVTGTFETIKIIINNKQISERERLKRIGILVSVETTNEKTFHKFNEVRQNLLTNTEDKYDYYNILEKCSIRLQNRVAGILKSLDLHDDGSSSFLINAIDNFKEKDGVINASAPTNFLNDEEQKYLMIGDKFRVSLYKVFLFQYVAKAIKSGGINLIYSHKYRSMDSYLISKERWTLEKVGLLERAGLTKFADPKPILKNLEQKLSEQFKFTNKRIYAGKNSNIKLIKNSEFIVNTPKQDEHSAEALAPYFPAKHFVPLTEMLATVNRQTNFTNELQHWQQQYNRKKSISSLLAGVVGLGCAIGVRKMARISSHIVEEELENAVNWHFSLENIRAANDSVLSYMDTMALPNIYRRIPEKLHTASDGQKFEVTADSLNANYSFKYFGKGQGVSAYTFIDERSLLWHSLVFSAAERESAYVIDGLMRNDVAKSDIHSTDTHGYSEVIFAITDLLGISFAPRIKNLKKQTLYIFKSANNKNYRNWAIKPSKTVDIALIEEYWDEILRLITTIKLKENSASDIFRRLNSYSKQHKLYTALKAFGRIIKSHFILRYIDDVELRQAIEKQLNKVELANRFTRAVAVGNPRNFVAGDKEDQEIAEACNRLIKNSAICWNYMFLENEYKKLAPLGQVILLEAIKTHSVISWLHFNFLGEYDFSEKKMKDSCGILPAKIVA